MHGASVVALTMYDMLKPLDKGIEISSIRLEKKSGGKSDYKEKPPDVDSLRGDCLFGQYFEGKSERSVWQNDNRKIKRIRNRKYIDEVVPDDFQ